MQECNCASQQTEDLYYTILYAAAASIFKNHVKTLQLSYLHFLEKMYLLEPATPLPGTPILYCFFIQDLVVTVKSSKTTIHM